MKNWILSILLSFALSSLAADTNRVEKLTLDQALSLAEQIHPDLAQPRLAMEAASGRARQAGLFPNPEAVARVESAPIRGRTRGEAEYLAGFSQTVPLSNRLKKAREAELLERDRLSRQLDLSRREIRKRVHSAFATALYQDQAFQLQQDLQSGMEKIVAITRSRMEAGDALIADLARAEIELARASVELKRSESLRQKSLHALAAAIGNPRLTFSVLDGSLDAAFDIPGIESLDVELSNHPALAMGETEVRAYQARVDLAKTERIPDINVELLYRRLEASNENAFDLGVRIPIPVFDRNQGRLREARAELGAAEARTVSARHNLELNLQEAYLALKTALENSRAWKSEILPRARTILDTSEARFAAGDISLSEMLPLRRDWAAMQTSYLESLRDLLQAWAALNPFLRTANPESTQ